MPADRSGDEEKEEEINSELCADFAFIVDLIFEGRDHNWKQGPINSPTGYFHDGEAATLKDAVNTMGRIHLGRQFTEEENSKIVAFLKTLTGKQPSFKLPILPPSSDKTPRPQPFS